MSQPERSLWNRWNNATKEQIDWTRLEAWVGSGIPDLNGVVRCDTLQECKGHELWVELKVIKTKSFLVKNLWRPQQIAWQTKRCLHARNVFNLVSHPDRGSLKIYLGSTIRRLVDEGPLSVAPAWEADEHDYSDALIFMKSILKDNLAKNNEREQLLTLE